MLYERLNEIGISWLYKDTKYKAEWDKFSWLRKDATYKAEWDKY
jgi:hypothetical protein